MKEPTNLKPCVLDQVHNRLKELGVPREFFTKKRTEAFFVKGWVLLVKTLEPDGLGHEQISVVLFDPENPKEPWL